MRKRKEEGEEEEWEGFKLEIPRVGEAPSAVTLCGISEMDVTSPVKSGNWPLLLVNTSLHCPRTSIA